MTNQEFARLLEKLIATYEGHHQGGEAKTKLSYAAINSAVAKLKRSAGKDLISDPPFDEMPQDSVEWILGEQMLWFDSLANTLRDRHRHKLIITCSSTLAFLWLFAIYAHAFHKAAILGVGCIFLAIAAFTVQFEGRKNHHAFLFARATAEVLRTYFFLAASGITIDLHSLVQRRYAVPLNSVLSSSQVAIENSHAGSRHVKLEQQVVLREWFQGQQNYYLRRSKELAVNSRRWFLISRISITVGLVLILASASIFDLISGAEHLKEAGLTIGPMLLSAGAVSEFFREKLGFEYLAERYANSVAIYQSNPVDLKDVGSQAIHEMIDWYVSSVDREISVPLG